MEYVHKKLELSDILEVPEDVNYEGYVDPIITFYSDCLSAQEKYIEDKVITVIKDSLGVSINKERLLSALAGDRQAYKDGYKQGYWDALHKGKEEENANT